jgi:hypothetical protein
MANRRVQLVVCLSILCVVAGVVVKLKADESSVEIKRTELVKAAKDAYDATDAAFKQNRCIIEEVYIWSRRLMQAEQLQGTNANAAAEHSRRMSDLRDYVLDLKEKNPQRSLQHMYLQSKYYIVEAEIGQATN